MKTSYIKLKSDELGFNFINLIGMDVFEIEDPEEIDFKIKELKNNNYNNVIISNELASFSSDVIRKYKNDNKFRIIITPNKRIKD